MKHLVRLGLLVSVLTLLLLPLPPSTVAAEQEIILLLDVNTSIAQSVPGTPPIALRVWGWAMRRGDGWTGLMENYVYGTGEGDSGGPSATSGVRAATAVLRIFDGTITETTFTLRARIEQVTNSSRFKLGDVRTLTGSWVTGQAIMDEPISDGKLLTLTLVGTIIRR